MSQKGCHRCPQSRTDTAEPMSEMFMGRTEQRRVDGQKEYDVQTTLKERQSVNSKYGERYQLSPCWSGLIFNMYDTPYGPFHVVALNCLCLRYCSIVCEPATIFASTNRLSLVLTTLTPEAMVELNGFRKRLRLPPHWGPTLESLVLYQLSKIFVNMNAMAPLTLSLFLLVVILQREPLPDSTLACSPL
jgi:hypothetical protein